MAGLGEVENGRNGRASTGSRASSCRQLDPAASQKIISSVTGRTDEALMAQFGISYNTWRKLAAGEPIRASLAQRIEDRLRTAPAS